MAKSPASAAAEAPVNSPDSAEGAQLAYQPGPLDERDVFYQYGLTQARLNDTVAKLNLMLNENAQLKRTIAALQASLEARQTPTGAPVGSAPRAVRRAGERVAAKRAEKDAKAEPTPIGAARSHAVKGAAGAGNPQ